MEQGGLKKITHSSYNFWGGGVTEKHNEYVVKKGLIPRVKLAARFSRPSSNGTAISENKNLLIQFSNCVQQQLRNFFSRAEKKNILTKSQTCIIACVVACQGRCILSSFKGEAGVQPWRNSGGGGGLSAEFRGGGMLEIIIILFLAFPHN